MSNATASHPTSEALSAFGLGKLSDPETEVIARHLSTCAECRRLVEGVAADSLVGLVRSTKQATVLPAADPAPSGPGLGQSQLSSPAEAPPPPADLPPELADHPKYKILRVLGRGGMGVVYEAEHRHMGRKVALKVISQSLVDRPEAVERFTREVRAAAKLNHPNIVTAHDAEQAGSLHLLVMEYVPGQSLAQVVEKKGPLPVAHACHFVRQAALGLQHASEQGMVHRDLKPQNLMVTPKGQVKILDFGLARLAAEKKVGPGLTAEDAVMGTPEYLAPEQALDARQADVRADLYSLGCTLYCLLAGQPPFPDGTAMQKIMAHLEKQPRPLPELRPDVPADLWAIIERLLAKDPSQRYQQPVEVTQALVPFIKGGAKPAASAAAAPPGVASPKAGTLLGGDTSKVLKLRQEAAAKPPAPEARAKEERSDPLEEMGDPSPAPEKLKKARATVQPVPAAWYRRPPLLAGAVAAVLALGLGAWLAAGVLFKVKTKDGLLVVEVNEPNPTVSVDGERITVTWADGGKRAEIFLKPGAHQVEVTKDGFTVQGDGPVTLEENGRRVLAVTLTKGDSGAVACRFDGTVPITAKKEHGHVIGKVARGETITLQYVSGKWKTWGRSATESPDEAVQEQGDQCRLALCEAPDGKPTKVLAVVPSGTKTKPFAWVADRDYEKLVLRINSPKKDFASNPDGGVRYRLRIEAPPQEPSPVAPPKDPRHTDTTPEPFEMSMQKAREVFQAALKGADDTLRAAFERQLQTLANARELSADNRIQRINIVNAEKQAFEESGFLPWSPWMRPAAQEYLVAYRTAEIPLQDAFRKSLADYRQAHPDLDAGTIAALKGRYLAPKVVGVWDCTGNNFKARFTRTLYANGKARDPDGPDTWKWEKDKLVIFHHTREAPGGVWRDECTISADGRSFHARNQRNAQYHAKLVRPSK